MKIFVGVTDNNWYEFLAHAQPDELNFWQPRANQAFRAIGSNDIFLFKLHSPLNYIAGGGFFVGSLYKLLPNGQFLGTCRKGLHGFQIVRGCDPDAIPPATGGLRSSINPRQCKVCYIELSDLFPNCVGVRPRGTGERRRSSHEQSRKMS